jgi:hypothetical protein
MHWGWNDASCHSCGYRHKIMVHGVFREVLMRRKTFLVWTGDRRKHSTDAAPLRFDEKYK